MVAGADLLHEALFATKLAAQPRVSGRVRRPRLTTLLDGAADARLVLVSAPAGFGKSTLLVEWLASAAARSAWISLDRGDNDVVRFTRYLAAAAARLSASTEPPPAIEGSGPFDPELALASILAAMTPPFDMAAVLVLDDYHLIDEPRIHRLVGSLIERLPSNLRLAIATRADPPLPLARLRARGELLEIRADGLRFTPSEACELLRSTGADLEEAEVESLTERTEGWAAALRLAGVSLRGRPNREDLVRRFGASHRFVLDYIVEEVLSGLAPETQEFLLRTSILERLSGPLCEAVTGDPDGQARLDEIERANLLIVPLDDERRWYRYHALFAEILRARLAAMHADELPDLHARACLWLEAHGDDDEAIAHAIASGDAELMSRVVALASGRYINAGELATMGRWLDALPPELVRGHAQLSASYAWYLVTIGQTEGVAERLADAERALAEGRDGGPAMRAGLPTQLAMLRSELASLEGDTETAVTQARLSGSLIPDFLPPDHTAILRGMASVLLAVALNRAGDLDGAAEAYEAGLPDLRAGGNVMALGRSIAELAAIAIARGDTLRALALCESEIAREGTGVSAARTPAVWAALATARAELGQRDDAERDARRALDVATRAGDAPIVRACVDLLGRLESERGDGAGAGPRSAAAAGGAGRGRAAGAGGAGISLVEPLTERELEVLRLVAVGRSNTQIAVELFVTVGTVKSHLHTISGKLGAANRVEAVARARSAGLLD